MTKKYYGVYMDFDYQEFGGIEEAISSAPLWCVVVRKKSEHISAGGNIYDLNKITFFDTLGDMVLPQIGKWKIAYISEPFFEWVTMIGGVNNFAFKDPVGVIEKKIFFCDIKSVIDALKYLNERSKFSSWESYHLEVTKDKLCEENERLKAKIKKLKVENESLREQLEQLEFDTSEEDDQ